MSKFLGILFALIMTGLLGYLVYDPNQIIENVVQVVFWTILIICYPLYVLVFIGIAISDDQDKKDKTAENFKKGKVRAWISGFQSIANIILMSVAGFFWLPIAYAITCLVTLLFRMMIIEIAKK